MVIAQHRMPVLFGSQTGTAQEVAEYLGGLASRRGFLEQVLSLDEFPVAELPQTGLVLFVVSTTGDGELPDNMKPFFRFLLRRNLGADSLQAVKFAVFGLGDSSYAKFNAAARKLAVRLKQLGAQELVERGLADEQSPKGIWGDLDPWARGLWTKLAELHPLPPGYVPDDRPTLGPPRYEVTVLPPGGLAGSAREALPFYSAHRPPDAYGAMPHFAPVLENRRLTAPGHFQDVRHIVLDVSGMPGGGAYQPGDVAWVHPENDPVGVEAFAALLGIDLDSVLHIQSVAPGGLHRTAAAEPITSGGGGAATSQASRSLYPDRCTVRELLGKYLDVLGTPRRRFFEGLSLFAQDEEEADKLRELSSPEGADLLHDYCMRERRSHLEVLEDFQSSRPPLARLLELIPPLRPRAFSIASSPLETPGQVHLCVAVVSYKTRYKRARVGVCSSWLARLTPGPHAAVPLWIRPGTFKLPASPWHPVVMVGPGTGIAPMRSMILHRRRQRAAAEPHQATDSEGESETARGGPALVPDTLCFGCRYRDRDFLYSEEWSQTQNEGGLRLHTAFSRDQLSKVYVQHRIQDHAREICNLICQRGAHVYVSGSAKQMPTDVYNAIREAIMEHGPPELATHKAAEQYLKALERCRRYTVEAWS